MEENALMGLQDEVTICELVVMTAYKNAVPDPYFKIVGQAGVNDIDLGPLHTQIIDHIEKLRSNTDSRGPLEGGGEVDYNWVQPGTGQLPYHHQLQLTRDYNFLHRPTADFKKLIIFLRPYMKWARQNMLLEYVYAVCLPSSTLYENWPSGG
ncbi:hypothetical protein B0H14DRAFT_3491785 [Mycena olivaceomarginata]|nr:hypothetical protein B0H14DRAFT_3491785 [Mycena olivaceomarginata]